MYTSIGINLNNKLVCIIGGGSLAYRRAKRLDLSGARVHVISPDLGREFDSLNIKHIRDSYKKSYIRGAFLVVVATDDREVNGRVVRDCQSLNILSNAGHDHSQGDLIFPSQVFNGSLNISVSTCGKYPALSKFLRKDMEKRYGKFTDEYIAVLEQIRILVLAMDLDNKKDIIYQALGMDLDQLKTYREELKTRLG